MPLMLGLIRYKADFTTALPVSCADYGWWLR